MTSASTPWFTCERRAGLIAGPAPAGRSAPARGRLQTPPPTQSSASRRRLLCRSSDRLETSVTQCPVILGSEQSGIIQRMQPTPSAPFHRAGSGQGTWPLRAASQARSSLSTGAGNWRPGEKRPTRRACSEPARRSRLAADARQQHYLRQVINRSRFLNKGVVVRYGFGWSASVLEPGRAGLTSSRERFEAATSSFRNGVGSSARSSDLAMAPRSGRRCRFDFHRVEQNDAKRRSLLPSNRSIKRTCVGDPPCRKP